MEMVNIHEAKYRFSKLIQAVEAGEEIIIARAGKPVAKLVRFEAREILRTPGLMKGKFEVSESFFDPLPDDVLDFFEGKK